LTRPGQLTHAVSNAVQKVCGIQPELSTSGGTSDGRFIAPYDIDVIELGPVNATIHQINECVAVEDVERLSLIYEQVLVELLA